MFALAAFWVLPAEENGSSDDRQEQTARSLRENRAAKPGSKHRPLTGATVFEPAVSLESFVPSAASFHNRFASIDLALPDKIPILRV